MTVLAISGKRHCEPPLLLLRDRGRVLSSPDREDRELNGLVLLLGRIAAGERLLGTTLELGTRKALNSTLAVSPLVEYASFPATPNNEEIACSGT